MPAVRLSHGGSALVDDADAGLVARVGRWWIDVRGERAYARGNLNGRRVYMHRLIAGEPGLDVDHRNGDGLDNRRANLRVATRGQNLCNQRRARVSSSRFKGVSLRRRDGRWEAYVSHRGRKVSLGFFDDEAAAARAYDAAALERYGAFAATNAALGWL